MEEKVDIVTNEDIITGQVTKKDAHVQGLLHRTVIAEVVNSKGEWLLVKQASDRQDPGQYVSPVGGHVRAGETIENALRREAQEELGLTEITFRYIGKAIYNRVVCDRRENHYFLQFCIESDQVPKLNKESVSYVYLSLSELRRELKQNPQQFGAAFHFVVDTFFRKELRH